MTRKTSVEGKTIDYKFVCNQNGLLMTAVDSGSTQEVKKILEECGDLTTEILNAPCGLMKITALQLAASKGRKADQLVKVLLDYGAKADSSDKVGRTPLHNAALVGNAKAVELLLKAGANVDACFQVNSWPRQSNYLLADGECNEFSAEFKLPVPECWGRTPLHQAVKGGNPECVHLLLEAKANVNAQDEKGLTPLLLAGTGIFPGNRREVNKYEEVVELLVKAGADVNAYSEFTGLTPMHHAAELCSLRAMKCLLDNKAVVPDMKSNGVRTVLHEAAHTGNVAMVELLLENGAEKLVNSRDRNGHTPLHKAAFAGSRECLVVLLKHGGNLAVESTEGVSVMDSIFSHIPRPVNFITDILDKHIVPNASDINSRNFKVTLDFSILCPNGCDRQMAVVTALMDSGSDLQQRQIIRHPLFETFLRFKWHRLRLFFYMLMAVHFGLVVSLSLFCSLRINGDYINSGILSLSHKALLFTAVLLAIHFVIQVVMLPRHYVAQYETWINLLSIVLSFTIAIGHLTGRMEPFLKENVPTEHAWVLHIMSFAVLLVWIEFMLLIGRIPTWGYYALMFYQVLRNVIKVLLTFSGLVIGFTLSFRVQFHDSDHFMTVWHSLVKTMVMMMGEYEYNDLFDGSAEQDMKKLRLIGTSRVIFFLFVVLSSIVLMNLMVGLAVNDIQELQVEGHMQRLLKQAEFVTHLENLTMHRLIPNWLHRLLAIRRSIDPKFEIQPSEFKSGNNLSYHLLERIICIAIRNRRNNSNYPKNSDSDQDLYLGKYMEFGSMSDEPIPSPASSVENSSVITMLHQLQMEIAEIKSALNVNQANMPIGMNHEEPAPESVRISRWTRPVTDIQDAQGILRRLRRTSKTQNVVV